MRRSAFVRNMVLAALVGFIDIEALVLEPVPDPDGETAGSGTVPEGSDSSAQEGINTATGETIPVSDPAVGGWFVREYTQRFAVRRDRVGALVGITE